jgi:hypothetical protein
MSNLKEMYDISDTAGFPIKEDEKLDIFRETVCGHPLIVKVLETFDFDFPDAKQTTFQQLCDYLVLHLPNVKHAQVAATHAHANLVAATAYSTLETESKQLKAELDKIKRKRAPKPKPQATKRQNKKQNSVSKVNVSVEASSELKYCHANGYQKSHTSAECKVLNADKKKFSNEMRRMGQGA